MRENRTSRLSERTEEGRKPDLLRLYTGDGGEPSSSGPVRGKGGARSREPLPRHTGGDPEPCEPVHEPTTDSQSGEVKTGGGAHHGHLRGFLDRRVMDGVIRRMIDKSRIVHRYVAGSKALS